MKTTPAARQAGSRSKPASSSVTMLGIDPGLTNVGYAVAEVDLERQKIIRTLELGVITTERDTHAQIRRTSDDYRRAKALSRELRAITERHRILIAASEMVTTTPYKRPSLAFGIALGVIASFDFALIQLLPRQIKKAVVGDRDAEKAAIIKWALAATRNDDVHWPTSARQNRMDLQYRARNVTLEASHQADALAAIQAALYTEQLRESLYIQRAISSAEPKP